MEEKVGKVIRVSRVLKELNISLDRLVEFLASEGHEVEARPTSKITENLYKKLVTQFSEDKNEKEASEEVSLKKKQEKEAIIEQEEKVLKTRSVKLSGLKAVGKIDLDAVGSKPPATDSTDTESSSEAPVEQEKETKTDDKPVKPAPEELVTNYQKLTGPKATGERLDLTQFNKKESATGPSKRKRRRISKPSENETPKPATESKGGVKKKKERFAPKDEISAEDIQKQVKETLEKLQGKGSKSKAAKYRREKRDLHRQKTEEELQDAENKTLKVTEFVTVSEVASMMDVDVSQVISFCMSLGVMVTLNQRLDEDTLALLAEEYGYQLEVSKTELEAQYEKQLEGDEDTGNLVPRPPVVTIMGHVDHGKTSLLDYIRNENVVAGEAGGITQHMGSYSVELEDGKKITFLDTPGHEAFTAMRARGGQIADIAVIIIAADEDKIKPQTEEAISHAKSMGLPIVVAINKVDKPEANPNKVKEELSAMNILVEDWGGKVQSQEISAKTGQGISDLLDKVLLEAEMMDLKASQECLAVGTVIDAQLQKGRGYVSTVIVRRGTLKSGDIVLAGSSYGKLKNILDERGKPMKSAGPSTIATIVGLDESPRAGDKFYVFEDEKEAKQIASQRKQQIREQALRTQKMMTLDEIGRRIAVGNFKELNLIIRGDVDGSVEALTGSIETLSTEEISINIISKSVGSIAASDIDLAAVTGCLIIGFNVKPSPNIKQQAEKEKVEIETFSTIYAAIDFVKDLVTDMESPVYEEQILGKAEVRELFKVSKLGTIAGCMVVDGKVQRIAKIRVIREENILFSGEVASLKRFKEDVKEVSKGFDCGIQVKDFNDLKEGDTLEIYQEVQVKKAAGKKTKK